MKDDKNTMKGQATKPSATDATKSTTTNSTKSSTTCGLDNPEKVRGLTP
ncbi:MAG: hypothetical protein L6V35_07635 [Alistipes putredinis]|nr:MAG: hypothetical protein L6V35_07635 [Alistipes putredinis]